MVYGLWSSAAGMAANQYRQNIAANNIANINTIGFKHDLAMLVERPVESREDPGAPGIYAHELFDRLSGGTHVAPTTHSFVQGPAIVTNKPLDLMIEGKGFFQVQTADGVRYTRDGRFTVNADGTLVSAAGGRPVLGVGGGTITVNSHDVQINGQGKVIQDGNVVGTLAVAEFDDVQKLRKQGANLFIAPESVDPRPASASRIVPGTLEGASIEPVTGLVDLIEASRAFQMNANLVSLQETMIGRAVNEIARF